MSAIMKRTVDFVNQNAVPSESPVGADAVFEALHALMHLHRAQRLRALRDAAHELTPMDARVLGYFGRRPGATQSALAEHTGRDKAQLARLVAGLRERGLLEAQPDPADRRNLLLYPTAEGRAVHQSLQRQGRRMAEAAVEGLDDTERRQLLELIDRVRRNLEAAGAADA